MDKIAALLEVWEVRSFLSNLRLQMGKHSIELAVWVSDDQKECIEFGMKQ